MEFQSAAVIGAGTMGAGIAQALAQHGLEVALCEPDAAALERARAGIEAQLRRAAERGKFPTDQMGATLGRIHSTTLAEAAQAEVVIEAVPEKFELKRDLFRQIDRLAPPETLLATNTSSISITALAAATRRPARCLGMHFMNPVPVMPLIEIVRGMETSDATLEAAQALAARLEKTAVVVRDFPGFVANRVLMPMINEAIYCVMEGVATAESVDEIMKLGMRHPMGPLALADLIGLDVCLDIIKVLCRDFHDSKYRPCPLLQSMVAAGRLGRKTGRGFYTY